MSPFLTKENISALEHYISEHYLGAHGIEKESLEPICLDESIILAAPRTPKPTCAFQLAPDSSLPLSERLDQLDESFAQTVMRLIDEHNLKDSTVYKRANMSRQLFAKLRKDDHYQPTKRTALALAFALELNLDDTNALLSRAGYTLSHSSKFDVIVEYFLVNDIHDIFQVNEALYAYDQPLLG